MYGDGDVRVGFSSGYTWTFNPGCLTANSDSLVDVVNLSLGDQPSTQSNNSYEELQVVQSISIGVDHVHLGAVRVHLPHTSHQGFLGTPTFLCLITTVYCEYGALFKRVYY